LKTDIKKFNYTVSLSILLCRGTTFAARLDSNIMKSTWSF